jgi:hypothetical protein
MTTTKKPLILETDGVIEQLPNGGIINAGGTSWNTFTVGGRGLLFDDGSSTSGGAPSTVGPTGPTGPTGGAGATGATGPTGKSAEVYRQRWNYTTAPLAIDGVIEFEIELGAAIIVYNLTVSRPVLVQIYGTPQKNEPNPYTFRATSNHLIDDGTTLLSDGTTIKTRQYSIFANLEEPVKEKVYARITNVSTTAGPVNISILYFAAATEQPPTPPPSPVVGYGTSFPSFPNTGELFLRTDEDRLYVYTGSDWVAPSSPSTLVGYGTAFPSAPSIGELFLRTDQDVLYVYDGTLWIATVGVEANAAGLDTQVQYNSDNLLAGSPKFTWENTSAILTVDGTISGKSAVPGGGALTIKAGDSSAGPGALLSVLGSNGSSGGNLVIAAGSTVLGDGGDTLISGGAGAGPDGSGGHLELSGGTSTQPSANIGSVILKTNGQERIRVNSAGAVCLSGATNYGLNGQILTSNGNAPPAWKNPAPPVAGGADGNIQYNSGGSIVGASEMGIIPGAFTVGGVLVVGKIFDSTPFRIKGLSHSFASDYSPTCSVEISGGDAGAGTGTGGSVYLVGGRCQSYGSAGSTYIYSGLTEAGGNATPGSLYFGTGTTTRAERLRITPQGAWGLGGSNFGSAGNILTSNGSTSPPTWQPHLGSAIQTITEIPDVVAALNADVVGKCVSKSTGTIQLRPNIFPAGGQFSIFNSSNSSMVIEQMSGLTLRRAGTPSTGNRNLAGYGFVTVLFITPTLAVVRGDGLT